MERTVEEINRVLDWAKEGKEKGSRFSGMSYEDGVTDTLLWVTGDSDDAPDGD